MENKYECNTNMGDTEIKFPNDVFKIKDRVGNLPFAFQQDDITMKANWNKIPIFMNSEKSSVSTEYKLTYSISTAESENEIANECLMDEVNYRLHIDNDDEEDQDLMTGSNLSTQFSCSDNINVAADNTGEKENSLQHWVQNSVNIHSDNHLAAADLQENFTLPDIKNNIVDSKIDESITIKPLAKIITSIKGQINLFKCEFCQKQFSSKLEHKFHITSHPMMFLKQDKNNCMVMMQNDVPSNVAADLKGGTSSNYVCQKCKKQFADQITLTVHCQTFHETDSLKQPSENCSTRSSSTISDVFMHSDNNNNTGVIVVATGNTTFETGVTGDNSTNMNANKNSEDYIMKQYKCYICDKQFARHSSLVSHIQFHEIFTLEKLKKNNQDRENSLTRSSIGEITKSPILDKDHFIWCQVCNKTYKSQFAFRRHMVTHNSLNCEEFNGADSRFNQNSEHNKHCLKASMAVTDEGSDSSRNYHISISNEYTNMLHQVNNDEPLPLHHQHSIKFKCSSCNQCFTTKDKMKKHAEMFCKALATTVNLEEANGKNADENVIKTFRCKFCTSQFWTESNLKIHYKSHHQLDSTDIVNNNVMLNDALTNKIYIEKDDGTFQCVLCDRKFKTHRGVIQHTGYHMNAELEQLCGSCLSIDNDNSDNNVEDNVSHKDNRILCPLCGDTFESFKGMRIHASRHQKEQLEAGSVEPQVDGNNNCISCSICGNTFKTLKGMWIHARIHQKDQPRSASVEPKADKNDHNRDDNCISSSIYDETCKTLKGMRIRASKHQGKQSRAASIEPETDENGDANGGNKCISCSICGNIFETFRGMRIHANRHKREPSRAASMLALEGDKNDYNNRNIPNYECNNDSINFKERRRNKAVIHRRKSMDCIETYKDTSSARKIYQCQFCLAQYSLQQSYASHMKIHKHVTLEDTMKCNMCGKFFTHKKSLTQHILKHMNGKITKNKVDLSSFQCPFCSTPFPDRQSLTLHQKLHEESSSKSHILSSKSEVAEQKRIANQSLLNVLPAKRRHSESAATGMERALHLTRYRKRMRKMCNLEVLKKSNLGSHMRLRTRTRLPDQVRNTCVSELESRLVEQSPGQSVGEPSECQHDEKNFTDKPLPADCTSHHKHMSLKSQGNDSRTDVADNVVELDEHAVEQQIERPTDEYFVFEKCEGNVYQCSECDQTHNNKLQLIVHMSTHLSKRWAIGHRESLLIQVDPVIMAPYACKFCDERFVNKLYRSCHLRKWHPTDVLQCDLCHMLFLSKGKLETHCQLHLPNKYQCERCLKRFSSMWFLKRHLRMKCAGKSLPAVEKMVLPKTGVQSLSQLSINHRCQFCGLLVNDEDEFLGHLQSHAHKYKCNNCQFQCENIFELESHACIISTTE